MTGASEYQGRSGPPHLMTRLVQSSSSTCGCIEVIKQHDQGYILDDDIRRLSKVATTPLQPQHLLEGFQRLAGSLNGLGRSVFSPCLCCLCCLAGRKLHSESSLRFLQTLLLLLCSASVPTSPRLKSKTSMAHVSAPPRSSNLLSTFAQAPWSFALLTSPRARNTCLAPAACSCAFACKHALL